VKVLYWISIALAPLGWVLQACMETRIGYLHQTVLFDAIWFAWLGGIAIGVAGFVLWRNKMFLIGAAANVVAIALAVLLAIAYWPL